MLLNGPGKYDDECAQVMANTNAIGVLLVVVEGDKGNGVSMKMLDPDLTRVMPQLLELLAKQMRDDARGNADA